VSDIKFPEKNNCDSLTFPEHIPDDILRKIMPVAKGWLKYYEMDIRDFTLSRYSAFKVDEGYYSCPLDFTASDLKKDPMRSVYSFAPNKKKYIDIYYYAGYDEERKGIFFSGEIDQLVWLYDLDKKMGYSIYNWGTSGSTDDVVWIDNDRFVLFQNCSDGLFLIDIFDIYNQIIVSYFVEKAEKELGYYGGYYGENAKKKGIREYE
jgi:hypothetical protein